jgi:prepilin-type N-terminal cleavage/methylation domain-containing protein
MNSGGQQKPPGVLSLDCCWKAGRRAFTLMELLVVIAVIAVLFALLLPVISRAKNQAARTTDLNNLRQIMVAVHVYTGENNDILTWPNWDYGHLMPHGIARPGWLYAVNPATNGPASFNAQAGLLWDSLHGGKVLLCPMDRPDLPCYSDHYGNITNRAMQLSSYIMNGAVIGFRTGYNSNAVPVKASQMLSADCILFEADDREPFSFNDGSSWPFEGITSRHLNGATQAALDGSSSYVRDEDWADDVAYAGKNRLWCYPLTEDGGDPVYGHDH